MSSDDKYNGWTNRETWAVALHINNDQGWRESVLEALREATVCPECGGNLAALTDVDSCPENFHAHDPRIMRREAGEIVRENVEDTLEMLLDSVETAEPNLHTGNPTSARTTYEIVREDIGSLWRVNWPELGEAFLSDLAELDGDA